MHLSDQPDPNTSYPFNKKAFFTAKRMANLYHLSLLLLSDQPDPDTSYPFARKAFFMATALNIAIPGGQKFEPLYRDMTIWLAVASTLTRMEKVQGYQEKLNQYFCLHIWYSKLSLHHKGD